MNHQEQISLSSDGRGGFRYRLGLLLLLVLFFLLNFPALKSGLPYIYNWDERGMMTPVIHTLKTGNFNQFSSPQETRIYDGYVHWAILSASVVNLLRETGRGAIMELEDLQFSPDWDLEISHPSFYLVGRLVVLIIGVCCLGLLYLVAVRITGPPTALLAVFILAITPQFGDLSTKALPYVPIALGVLLAVYCLLRYEKKPTWPRLILCGLAIALASSVRVNAITILLPAAAVVLGKKTPNRIARLGVLAAISFLGEIAINFHQLISFDLFLVYLHRLTKQSYVTVPGYADGVAGWEQAGFYGKVLLEWLGGVGGGIVPLYYFGIFALPGLLGRKRWGKNLIVWSVPGLLFLHLIIIHYNRVVQICFLLPFAALLIAMGVSTLLRVVSALAVSARFGRRRSVLRRGLSGAFLIVLTLIFVFNPIYLLGRFWGGHQEVIRDSRTEAMAWLADNTDLRDTVIIAEELRIHPDDLRRPKLRQMADYCRSEEFRQSVEADLPLNWMAGWARKLRQCPESLYRQPDLGEYFFQAANLSPPIPPIIIRPARDITSAWLARNNIFQGYIVAYNYIYGQGRRTPVAGFKLEDLDKPVKKFGTQSLFIDRYSLNPRLEIYQLPSRRGFPVPLDEVRIDAPPGYFSAGEQIVLYRRGSLVIPAKDFAPGKYRLWLNARCDKLSEKGPRLRISLISDGQSRGSEIDDLAINSRRFRSYVSLSFTIDRDSPDLQLRLEFYYDDLQRRRRVLYINSLFLESQETG